MQGWKSEALLNHTRQELNKNNLFTTFGYLLVFTIFSYIKLHLTFEILTLYNSRGNFSREKLMDQVATLKTVSSPSKESIVVKFKSHFTGRAVSFAAHIHNQF